MDLFDSIFEDRFRLERVRRELSDFHEAWRFLHEHQMVLDSSGQERLAELLCIDVVKVNPKTKWISRKKVSNTETRIWLEFGPWHKREDAPKDKQEFIPEDGMPSHDFKLDCGAPTFEEAIVKLAGLVLEHYGEGK